MANPRLEALGINPNNLEQRYSLVSQIKLDEEKNNKLNEGFIQSIYMLNPGYSIPIQEFFVCNSSWLVSGKGQTLQVNSITSPIKLKSSVIELKLYENSIHILCKDQFIVIDLPSCEEVFTLKLTEKFSSLKLSSFGNFTYIISAFKVTRIEECTNIVTQTFNTEIIAIDIVNEAVGMICIFDNKNMLKLTKFDDLSVVHEYECLFSVTQLISINEDVVLLYCNDRYLIAAYNFQENQITYTIFFNSKLEKLIKYCEETEQLMVLNKNSSKLIIFSLDDNTQLSKYVSFALPKPAVSFECMILENTLSNEAIFEGNSQHQFYISHENEISLYSIEVVATKIIGYRFGDEPSPLNFFEDFIPDADETVLKRSNLQILSYFKENESSSKKETLKQTEVFEMIQSVNRPNVKKEIKVEEPWMLRKIVESEAVKPVQVVKELENVLPSEIERVRTNEIEKVSLGVPIKTETLINEDKNSEILKALELASLDFSSMLSDAYLSKSLQIAFKSIEGSIKESIQTSIQAILPQLMTKAIQDFSKEAAAPIQKSLEAGFAEIKSLNSELTSLVNSLAPYLAVQIKEKPISLEELILTKNRVKLREILEKGQIEESLDSLNEKTTFLFGFLLIELLLEGESNGTKWIEAICKKISATSEYFAEFYMKISNTSCTLLNESLGILELKF